MKPHLMRKADFIKDKGIVDHNATGIYVVRDGNKYQFGVELDVDSVVFVNETEDKHEINRILDDTMYEIGEIRERFDDCFKEWQRLINFNKNRPVDRAIFLIWLKLGIISLS